MPDRPAPQPPGQLTIEIAGETIDLLPERAAYWPAAETLLVADLHLGKERSFAAAGIAIPPALLDETLSRLAAAIQRVRPQRVLILGDLVHDRRGTSPETLDRVGRWRSAQPAEFHLVPGNHDRDAAAVASHWNMTLQPAQLREGPFRFIHEPDDGVSDAYTLGGHFHPVARVGAGNDTVRLPCFRIGARVGVLPAFSVFSGRTTSDFREDDRLYAVAGPRVIAFPLAGDAPALTTSRRSRRR